MITLTYSRILALHTLCIGPVVIEWNRHGIGIAYGEVVSDVVYIRHKWITLLFFPLQVYTWIMFQ